MTDARADCVAALLRRCGALDRRDDVIGLAQILGGWSRHSYLLDVESGSNSRRRYVVRCKPRGALLDTDLRQEYETYRSLAQSALPVPQVIGIEEDGDNPLGGPFFVMDFVEGRTFNIFNLADQQALAQDWRADRNIGRHFVEFLGQIHTLPRERQPQGLPRRSFLQTVEHWRSIYEERRLVRDPVVEEAFAWIASRVPADEWLGLVHGDYRIGNTLVEGTEIRAILDWELSYIGDVRFDLGYLAMERSAGKHLTRRSPLFAAVAEEEWFFARYCELTGRVIDRDVITTFEMLAIMMVLATQIMAVSMYARGLTSDMRMAWSRFSLPGLRQDMVKLMDWKP